MNQIGPIESAQIDRTRRVHARLMNSLNPAKPQPANAPPRHSVAGEGIKYVSIAQIASKCMAGHDVNVEDLFNSDNHSAQQARREIYYLLRSKLHMDTLSIAFIFRKTEATIYNEVDIYLVDRASMERAQ